MNTVQYIVILAAVLQLYYCKFKSLSLPGFSFIRATFSHQLCIRSRVRKFANVFNQTTVPSRIQRRGSTLTVLTRHPLCRTYRIFLCIFECVCLCCHWRGEVHDLVERLWLEKLRLERRIQDFLHLQSFCLREESMAQDVKAEECIGRKWDVTHIPEELPTASSTVHVLAASINPKLASVLIRDLGTKAPLTSLAHVKRIRRKVTEGNVQLSIILCPADGDVSGDTLSIPNDVADIVEEHSLVPFVAQVSTHPASNREEWQAQCVFWPTTFHPNAFVRGAKLELDESDAENARKFMEAAIYQARLAHGSGQLANGAVIVDPSLGSVIAWGHDQCTVASQPSPQFNEASKEKRIRHPLRHAVIEAITMAANRDRLFFPSNGISLCAPCPDETSEFNSAAEFRSVAKKARVDLVDMNGLGSETFEEGGHARNPQDIPRPYLCTGFDAYVTREPCAMCAMAMVHQRVRRVFFGVPNTFRGALGSKYRLQGVQSLNHHYTVFQVSISESELVEPL